MLPVPTAIALRLVFTGALLLLGACRTLPPVPPIGLQLISSAPLQLSANCVASESVVVDFVIEAGGSTSNIAIPAASACLQEALRAWVASFEYAPLPAATPSSIEWVLVTAPKL
jgi:hypothetical protein